MRCNLIFLLAALGATPVVAQTRVQAPLPAAAPQINENEELAMRLIFEDCVGYVRYDREPFRTYETAPVAPDSEATLSLPPHIIGKAEVRMLFPPRYAATWGNDGQFKFCMITTPLDENRRPRGIGRLGARVDGFVDRLTQRARMEGVPYVDLISEEFRPPSGNMWSEKPGEEAETAMVIMVIPTEVTVNGAIADAGAIMVTAPSDYKPASVN